MRFVALSLIASAVLVAAHLEQQQQPAIARRHQGHAQIARAHRRKVKRGGCKAVQGTITSAAALAQTANPTTTWAPQSTWEATSATWQASSETWQPKVAQKNAPDAAWSPSSSDDWASPAAAAATAKANHDNQDSSSSSSSQSNFHKLANAGITSFTGNNTGIGSWFRTNSGQDSTNGMSWCQLRYQDSWMGFAPSVDTMLGNFGWNTASAAGKYCGLEAIAYNPNNGKSATIYIVDGFAAPWVRTPGSVDLTLAAFEALYGSFDNNKDTVIQNLQWTLTGNVKQEYTYEYGKWA